MPTFQGLVTEDQVVQLVEYVKSLGLKAGDPLRRKFSESAKKSERRVQARESLRHHMITAAVQEREHYLNASYGLKSWLLTKDHKRIALLYLATITLFFFLGGAFATLIRVELLTPQGDLVSSETYNKLFTMHGVTMIFFFLIPVHPGDVGQLLPPDHDRRARSGVSQNSTC